MEVRRCRVDDVGFVRQVYVDARLDARGKKPVRISQRDAQERQCDEPQRRALGIRRYQTPR